MTVDPIKSWVYDPDTGLPTPVFTAQEARLLLDYADHERAAAMLSDKDWQAFRHARDKLLIMEHMAKRAS